MSGTPAEFIRALETAFGDAVRVEGRQVSVATPAAGLAFTLSPLPPLRLGRLELPRQEVAVAVVKGEPAAAAELLARIDRATQRGGG